MYTYYRLTYSKLALLAHYDSFCNIVMGELFFALSSKLFFAKLVCEFIHVYINRNLVSNIGETVQLHILLRKPNKINTRMLTYRSTPRADAGDLIDDSVICFFLLPPSPLSLNFLFRHFQTESLKP